MPSFSYRLKSNVNKNVSIYISFRPPNSKPIFCRTGFNVNPSDWSKSKKRAKPNTPQLKILNNNLNSLESYLSHRVNQDQNKGVSFTNSWLQKSLDEFNNKVENEDLSYLLNLYDELVEGLKLKKAKDGSIGLKVGTIKNYQTFRLCLTNYEKHVQSRLRITDFGKEEFDGFVSWLINDMNYSKNVINRRAKRMKNLLKYGISKGFNPPFMLELIGNEYSFKTKKYINVITEDEFISIANLKNLPDYLENIRRWLLIGLSIGQRISDLKKLTPESIRYDDKGIALIDIIQVKGEEPVTVPVDNQIVINILKHKFPRKVSNQRFNDYMKELCEKAGINQVVKGYKKNPLTNRKELVEAPKFELLSSHDMRRSFATYYYDKGVSVNLIMKITGHKRESTFYEYIGRNPNRDVDAYNFLNATK